IGGPPSAPRRASPGGKSEASAGEQGDSGRTSRCSGPGALTGGRVLLELSQFPRCPRCGIYLIVGFGTGPFVDELKARFAWKVLRYDQGVRRAEADAVVVSCAGRHCPRCKSDFDRVQPDLRAEA